MLDDGFYAEFQLAHELGKSVAEIRKMQNREWLGWNAYFKRRNAEGN